MPLAIKKECDIMLFAATRMDLEIIILSEVKSETNTIRYHVYVESKL